MLLTADQPTRDYWITVQSQFDLGTPNGYAILHYAAPPPPAPPMPPMPPSPVYYNPGSNGGGSYTDPYSPSASPAQVYDTPPGYSDSGMGPAYDPGMGPAFDPGVDPSGSTSTGTPYEGYLWGAARLPPTFCPQPYAVAPWSYAENMNVRI